MSVDFVDAQHGWAVGECGTVLVTSNGGVSWTSQPTPVEETLTSVCFVDAQHGWAAGPTTVIATSDGGQHWARQLSLPIEEGPLYDVDFGSDQVGVVSSWGGVVYRTADGGLTWEKVQTPTEATLYGVDMAGAQTGWACGKSNGAAVLLRTADGGVTWLAQDAHPASYLTDVQALSGQVALACGYRADTSQPVVLRTIDGGSTWSDIATWDDGGHSEVSPFDGAVAFLDGDHGWVLTREPDGSYSVRYTADAGQSWTAGSEPNGGFALETHPLYTDQLDCTDASHVFVAAGDGVRHDPGVFTSSDGGQTWSAAGGWWGLGFAYAVCFPTSSDGWVAANALDAGAGTDDGRTDLLHTADGGESWEAQQMPTGHYVYDLDFINSQIGWTVGDSVLAHTTNGGDVWAQQAIGYDLGWSGQLRAVDAIDATHAWAVGDRGLLIHTSDGSFWGGAETPAGYQTYDLHDVSFVNSTTGCVVGESGLVMRTTDGGATWTGKTPSAAQGETLLATCWTDAEHGWAVGEGSTIISTADGGKTWKARSAGPFYATLNAVSFSDAQHGWIAGEDIYLGESLVLRTDDGGVTWRPEGLVKTAGPGYDVETKGANTVYLTSGVALFATTNGGVSPVESTPPVVSLKVPGGTWHNRDVTVTVSASDAGSGVKAVYASVDREVTLRDSSVVVDTAVLGQGLHAVRAAAMDEVGNGSAPVYVKVGIDTRRPTKTAALNHPSVRRGGRVWLKFRVYDPRPGCGKARVWLYVKTRTGHRVRKIGLGTKATNKTLGYHFRANLARGTYRWAVSARDIAGNTVASRNVKYWTVTVR